MARNPHHSTSLSQAFAEREATVDLNVLESANSNTNSVPFPTNIQEPPFHGITFRSDLPPTTISTFPTTTTYINTHAAVFARAITSSSGFDALNLMFLLEDPSLNLPPNPTQSQIRSATQSATASRLHTKASSGSLLVESDNFAAVACWTPTPIHRTPPQTPSPSKAQPIFNTFADSLELVRQTHLYPICTKYWYLNVMARDPDRSPVKGAVRAVLEPFFDRARRENVPVWIEAGNERARDVYGYFGCVVMETVEIERVKTWCMLKMPESSRGV